MRRRGCDARGHELKSSEARVRARNCSLVFETYVVSAQAPAMVGGIEGVSNGEHSPHEGVVRSGEGDETHQTWIPADR